MDLARLPAIPDVQARSNYSHDHTHCINGSGLCWSLRLGERSVYLCFDLKEDVVGLMLFPATVYKYVPALLVALPCILIHPTAVFVIIEYLAYTW